MSGDLDSNIFHAFQLMCLTNFWTLVISVSLNCLGQWICACQMQLNGSQHMQYAVNTSSEDTHTYMHTCFHAEQTHLLALNVLLNDLLALSVAARSYFVLYLLKFKESEVWLNTSRISQENSLQKTPKSEYISRDFDGSIPAYSPVFQLYMLSLSLHSQNSPFVMSLQPSSTNLLGLLIDLVKFCKNTKRTV